MSAGPSPVGRLRAAADTLDRLDQAATKAPWLAIIDHDICAVAIPAGECTCRARGQDDFGHQPGCGHDLICYPDRGPDDARLIAAARSLAGPVAALLRSTADRSASGNDIPAGRGLWLEDALALADAVLASTRTEADR